MYIEASFGQKLRQVNVQQVRRQHPDENAKADSSPPYPAVSTSTACGPGLGELP